MSQEHTIPVYRFVSGCLRWPHSCVYARIGDCLVDPEDHEFLAAFRWINHKKPRGRDYVRRSTWNGEKTRIIPMHIEVWQRHFGAIPEGFTVDHKNRFGWDNRSENLRLATASQQGFNKGIQTNNSSGFRGVSWNSQMGKYKATIRCKPRRIHLGYFGTAEEAASAYNRASLELHGEFSGVQQHA